MLFGARGTVEIRIAAMASARARRGDDRSSPWALYGRSKRIAREAAPRSAGYCSACGRRGGNVLWPPRGASPAQRNGTDLPDVATFERAMRLGITGGVSLQGSAGTIGVDVYTMRSAPASA